MTALLGRPPRLHPSGQRKTCPQCRNTFRRHMNSSQREWDGRVFCSTGCSNLARLARRGRAPRVDQMPAPLDQVWMAQARCRDSTDEFVPDSASDAEGALRWCRGCPVAARCLAYGLATKAHGVWGGRFLRHGEVVT